jgi:aminocarboxymuconate-semialdehyde decarboxylase
MVDIPNHTKKIDADSHFFPDSDFGDLSEVLNGYSKESFNMLLRDAAVFTHPNPRRGGFHMSNAGKEVGAVHPNDISKTGPQGHGIVEDRVKLLPQTGFDMQVLIPDGIFGNPFGSPIARQTDPGLAMAICVAYNNATSAAQKAYPDQMIGTGVVPFHGEVEPSRQEAIRAVKDLGLKALTINGNWGGKNYDDLDLFPFWQTVNELNVPLFVHHNPWNCQINDHVPTTFTVGGDRLRRLHISNYVGFAMEYMLAISSLTLGGVLREFPNLKFCFFESGGSWLPWMMFTLDHTYRVERQCARCDIPPSEHIKQSVLMAIEPDEKPIIGAIHSIGADNFIVGSDYPHPPSTYPNTAAGVENMDLTREDKDKILGGNVQQLFGIA